MIHKLVIKDLQLTAGTQQRTVSGEIVKEYMEVIKGGEPLPPVEVVTDGKDTWLWNGFHRLIAYRKLGKDYIQANITEGTRRDAIWLSFTANVKHGFRRTKGTAKEIIRKILIDPEWSKVSLTDIGKHVGVSQQFVGQVKKAMEQQKTEPKPPKEPQDPKDTAPEPVLDAMKKPVPEHLQPVFKRADEIKVHITYLNQMVRDIKKGQEENDLLWINCKLDSLKSDVGNLRRSLKFSLPYAICPYCFGDVNNEECRACNGHGFVNELQWKACPAELKE